MFCSSCGTRLPEGSAFCHSCGGRVGLTEASEGAAAVAPPREGRKRALLVAGGAVAAGGVVIVVALIVLLVHPFGGGEGGSGDGAGPIWTPAPGPGTPPPIRTPSPTRIEVEITGAAAGEAVFSPNRIELQRGETAKLVFKNGDSRHHIVRLAGPDGAYDTSDDYVGRPDVIPPGGQVFIFVRFDEPGQFEFRDPSGGSGIILVADTCGGPDWPLTEFVQQAKAGKVESVEVDGTTVCYRLTDDGIYESQMEQGDTVREVLQDAGIPIDDFPPITVLE